MLNNYVQWVVVLFQDEVFSTFCQLRLPHWFFTSFFCVPAVGWNGANTASKALTRSQWALPSKTTWWYLCFFQFCIRDYLGYCRLYAKSDLVQAKNLKVWTTLDIWSSKLKTSNFAIDPPTRLTSPPDFPIFSGEHYCDLLSPYRFSDDQFKFFFIRSKLSVTISHIVLNVRTQTNPI